MADRLATSRRPPMPALVLALVLSCLCFSRPEAQEPALPAPGEDDAPPPTLDEEPLFLDLDQIELADAYPFQFHGRLDLAYVHFADSENIDRHRKDQVLPLSPALYGEYTFFEGFSVIAEIEYDGREEEVEVDQAVFRLEALPDWLTIRVGRYYYPFGLERRFYSPDRNTLVDRPAVARVVYPGTYADNGIFAEGKFQHHTDWTIGYEAAITQGLRGFENEDKPKTLRDNNDTPQLGARVYFQPRSELSMGVSYTIAYWDDRDRRLLDFFGFDARLNLWETELRAEYIGGRVEDTEDFGDFFRQGWYLHLEHEIEVEWGYLQAIVPVGRIDWTDANDEVKDVLDATRYSAGLAFFFVEGFQAKLEYSVSDERGGHEISNNGFLAQLVFHW